MVRPVMNEKWCHLPVGHPSNIPVIAPNNDDQQDQAGDDGRQHVTPPELAEEGTAPRTQFLAAADGSG